MSLAIKQIILQYTHISDQPAPLIQPIQPIKPIQPFDKARSEPAELLRAEPIPIIDVSSEAYKKKLEMANALADLSVKEKELKQKGGYSKAYFLSIILPPIGVYYFIKYVFFGEGDEEAKRAGIISLVLTLASILLSFILFAVILNQVASVIPGGDVQMLKELTSPEKQKELLQLYR